MYFNDGLHYLHLEPARPWNLSWQDDAYSRWKYAEVLSRAFVSNAQEAFGSTVKIIFMTLHAICHEFFFGAERKSFAKFRINAMAFAQPCVERRTQSVGQERNLSVQGDKKSR